jgi:hypothetical protein
MSKRSGKSIAPKTTDATGDGRDGVVFSGIVPAVQPANDAGPSPKHPAKNGRAPIKIVGMVVTDRNALSKNLHHPLASLTAEERCRAARRAIGRLVVSITRKKQSS